MNRTICFIIAPIDVNLDSLKEFLINDYGLSIMDITDIENYTNVSEVLREQIKKSELICAVLFGNNLKNTYLEVGIAIGLGKPIFLITDNPSKIPFSLRNYFYINIDSLEIEKIKFGFSAFYNNIILKPRKREKETSQLKSFNKEYIVRPIINNKRDLADFIFSIIKSDSNIFQVNREHFDVLTEKGFDLLIWSDLLTELFGNPIPIELKFFKRDSIISNASLERTAKMMRNYLIKSNLNLGLIIYSGKKTEIKEKYVDPFIFIFNLEELILYLNKKKISFSQLIIERRNRMVHSGGF